MRNAADRGKARQALPVLRTIVVVLAITAVCLLESCSVAGALSGKPGVDIADLKPGMARSTVKARLGMPLREWTTANGARYALYRYDAGVAPSAMAAAGHVFINIATAGVWEGFMAYEAGQGRTGDVRRVALLAVAYDSAGYALGVFVDIGEFDPLPDDGRSTAKAP